MEPMTLGSPSGSSHPGVAGGSSVGYLPSFLMGDPPTTPRPNTLSPTRGRASLAYSHGLPGMAGSPPDSLRSSTMLHQSQHQQHPNPLSSSFIQPQTPQGHQGPSAHRFLQNSTAPGTPFANQFRNESFDANSTAAGPPTQGLFDSWRREKQMLRETPARAPLVPESGAQNQSLNESVQNQSGFNVSRVMSPIPHPTDFDCTANVPSSPTQPPPFGGGQQHQPYSNWVTIFGFPVNAVSIIMSHFIGVGTIIDKHIAPQGGNWVYLRYSSRIECDRAVNYNGRVISPGLMIGVQHCSDPAVVGKENDGDASQLGAGLDPAQRSLFRVRSLMNVSYSTMQQATAVVATPPVQKRPNGIVNKAMDLFFGW